MLSLLCPYRKGCAGCKPSSQCSKTCQKKPWHTHTNLCSDLKLESSLTRAAALTRDAYLTFRKNTWSNTIKKVEDPDDELITYDGDPWENSKSFAGFPDDIIPDNRRARLGVLTAWMCEESYTSLATLIEEILHGKYFQLHFMPLLTLSRPQN